MLYLGIFWLELLKQLLPYLKSTASNLSAWKVCIKAKMSFQGIFGLDFKNAIVIIEISAFKFFLVENFGVKIKIPKFGTKNALFGYFGPQF